MTPTDIAAIDVVGQTVAFLGSAIAAAAVFFSGADPVERIKKATSRGLAVVALGTAVQLFATAAPFAG